MGVAARHSVRREIPLPTALGGYFGALSARTAYAEAMSLNFPPEARAALASKQP